MLKSFKVKSIHELTVYQKIVLVLLAFIFGILIFYLFPAPPGDLNWTFYPVSHRPFQPYDIKTFNYPPWTSLFLFPLHFFPENLSQAINASLNLIVFALIVVKRKGNTLSLVLTLTSLPFLATIAQGYIEWIPGLGFILQNGWGLPMLLAKPQSGSLAALSWFLSAKNKGKFLLPAILTIIISFILWGNWPVDLIASLNYFISNGYSFLNATFPIFPWAIPIGLGLILYILKYKPNNSEILGTLATFCLVPYFTPQSLLILFALLSVSYPRLAILAWIAQWLIFFI